MNRNDMATLLDAERVVKRRAEIKRLPSGRWRVRSAELDVRCIAETKSKALIDAAQCVFVRARQEEINAVAL